VTLRLLLLTILLASFIPAPAAAAPDPLVGLWKAQRWFGPHARGRLVVQRAGGEYVADMVGRRMPLREERGELAFDLPNGQGRFRGRFDGPDLLRGHWFPPPSSAVLTGFTFASPVRLTRDGPDRWSGDVVPAEDRFTLYLLVEPRPDGTLRALLRNPDRDFGTWLGVESVVRDSGVVTLRGRRAGQPDVRDLSRGRYDAERDVISLEFPTRGGGYEFRREDPAESDFHPRGKAPQRYGYVQPPARDDGWPTGSLEDAGIDRAAMERFVQRLIDSPQDSVQSLQFHGLLVARRGKLVLEEYFHGEHRDRLHDTRSAAKSLTAIVVGAAIESGAPLALSTPVYAGMNGGLYPAGLDEAKKPMTLEHLLTMSAGFFCDDTNPDAPGNEETMMDQSAEPDWYRYSLAVPLATPPGEKAVYCSAMPHLALGMVGRATGESPMATFDRLVGDPLKIHRYGWSLDPAGNPYGGGSVALLPRDLLKLGQLMLNGGTWEGRRILGREFAARAVDRLYHLRNVYYGYLWWGIDYPYKERTVRAYFAAGAGGQGIVVVPELDLVVAHFGANYSAPRGPGRFFAEFVPRHVLPAVREKGDDPRAPVTERAFTTPYGRSDVGTRVSAGPK
jgi:CubicO group peptidase (beta-lactamase class C family)